MKTQTEDLIHLGTIERMKADHKEVKELFSRLLKNSTSVGSW
jgi:hypothetical protein